jgi:hypothetical protein
MITLSAICKQVGIGDVTDTGFIPSVSNFMDGIAYGNEGKMRNGVSACSGFVFLFTIVYHITLCIYHLFIIMLNISTHQSLFLLGQESKNP